MRVLDVHAEHCSFAVVAAPPAEDAPEPEPPVPDPGPDAATPAVPAPREGGFDDCLAAFVAVEGADARDPGRVAERAADHLAGRADDLRRSRVLLYPCPALSERAADHGTTVECCRALARALPDDHDLLRAPVGWHHALTLETAGHPFGEAVTRFTADPAVEEWTPEWAFVGDGERRDPDAVLPTLDEPTREAFELAMTGPTVDQVLARGESDPSTLAEPDGLGGRRLLPAGRLVHDLLADRVHDRSLALGATPVGTAVTVDPSDPEVARLLGALGEPAREGPVLRPSTRLGVCALLRDAALSPGDCPLVLAENGPVDGERGATTTPAVNAVTADRDAAWATLREFAALATDLAAGCGLAAAPVCRVGADVPADRLDALAAALDPPLLVGRDPTSTLGPGDTVRLAFHDPGRDPGDAPHVRLDPGLAERAGIAFDATGTDGDGGSPRDHPVLVDCAPLGSLDGTREALPSPVPVWLAPTQVRFVTVDAAHRDRATDLADAVADAGLRADVDDRSRPVGERLDRAASDGVPFVAVVGDREVDGGDLSVQDRREGIERSLPVADLVDLVATAVGDRPRRRRYLPLLVDDGPLWGGSEAE